MTLVGLEAARQYIKTLTGATGIEAGGASNGVVSSLDKPFVQSPSPDKVLQIVEQQRKMTYRRKAGRASTTVRRHCDGFCPHSCVNARTLGFTQI